MNSIMHKRLKLTIYYCIGIILVGIILQLLSFAKGNEIFFPNIFKIIETFFKLLVTLDTYKYILTTLLELLIALAISFAVGIILGVIAGIKDAFYQILKPLMSVLRCLPIIVLIVILMIVVRLSMAPVLATIIIITPIVYEGTYRGIRSIDKELIDAYKINTNTNAKVVLKIFLPLISGHSKASYTNALGMGIKILITTEYLCGVDNTLGRAIIMASQNLEYEKIYAYSFILVFLILLLEFIPKLIEICYYKISNFKYRNYKSLEMIED